MKVAISQRIIPHYRVAVFSELAKRKDIDLTVFYGNGFKTGSQSNSSNISGFKSCKLLTIKLNYTGVYKSPQLRVWHPTLFWHLMVNNFDVVIVEPSTNFYNNVFTFIYCLIFRKKLIWHSAGSIERSRRPLFRRLIDPFLDVMIKYSDAFLTYNSFAESSLIRDNNINSKLIFRAQNTVDTNKIEEEISFFSPKINDFKKSLGLNGFKLITYIGGVEKRKKINYLINIVSRLNQNGIKAKALIIGDGPDKKFIQNTMSTNEKLHTIFFGKKINDATKYILISDLIVLPSSGGLSVVNAMKCGKPFIGSKEIEHGGIVDYIQHGQNGYLFEEDNIDQFYFFCEELLTDDELYLSMSNCAKIKSKDFNTAKMVDGYINAIKFVLSEK